MKFFRRPSKDNIISDDLGEWLIIRGNRVLNTITSLFSDAIISLKNRDFQLYMISAVPDERIPNFIQAKLMLVSEDRINMRQLEDAFKTGEKRSIIGLQYDSIEYSDSFFYFLRFDAILRSKKGKRFPTKLLLPPFGISPSVIPLALEEMISALLGGRCSMEEKSQIEDTLNLVAHCIQISAPVRDLAYRFSYFGSPEIKVKTDYGSGRQTAEIKIYKVRTTRFIPITWNARIERN